MIGLKLNFDNTHLTGKLAFKCAIQATNHRVSYTIKSLRQVA